MNENDGTASAMTYAEAVAQARLLHPNWPISQVENLARGAVDAQEKQAALDAVQQQVAAATDEDGNFSWDALVPESAARRDALEADLAERSERAAERDAEAEIVNAKIKGWEY